MAELTPNQSNIFEDANKAIESQGAAVDFVADLVGVKDAINVGATISNLATKPVTLAAVGTAALAIGKFALNFIPMEKVAVKALGLLGRGLGVTIGKKVFTKAFEAELANVGFNALKKGVSKGIFEKEALLQLEKNALSDAFAKRIASTVHEDIEKITGAMISKKSVLQTGKLDPLYKTLTEIGFDKGDETLTIARQLRKSKMLAYQMRNAAAGKLHNKKVINEAQEILEKEITASLKADFSRRIEKEDFGKFFRSEMEKKITGEGIAPRKILGVKLGTKKESALFEHAKLSPEERKKLEDELINGQEKVFKEAGDEGIERGVKEGMARAFKNFRPKNKKKLPHLKFKKKAKGSSKIIDEIDEESNVVAEFKGSEMIDWERLQQAENHTSRKRGGIFGALASGDGADSEAINIKDALRQMVKDEKKSTVTHEKVLVSAAVQNHK